MRPSTSRGPTPESDSKSVKSLNSKSSSANSSGKTAVSTVVSIKSMRVTEVFPEIPKLTEEQKLRLMLGFKDEDSNKNSIFEREDFCGACGVQHPNPSLLDTYPFCEACTNCMRDQSHLRERYKNIDPETPLEILFATYGDVKDSRKAIVVSNILQNYVNNYACKDRLIFRESQRFDKIFGKDPSFDKPKQLRLRYRINGVHGLISLDIMANNHIPEEVMLFCPIKRDITVLRASYGHPKGRTTTGRMSYDVMENLQGIVDLNGGSLLYISPNVPIIRKLGDPCTGYTKDLKIDFDISGKSGKIEMGEIHGHLKHTIRIQASPKLSPMILVNYASYGLTENTIKDRLKFLEAKLAHIDLLIHKRLIGMPIKVAERQLIKKQQAYKDERAELKVTEPVYVDVTRKIQMMIGKSGGLALNLLKGEFDPNFTFGNPLPGKKKLLEVSLKSYGHDSESRADSKEITSKGFLKNFILGKKARFLVPVKDDAAGVGILEESLIFETLNVLPLMKIDYAMYGHPQNNRKTFDVTSTIQNMVNGQVLEISKDIQLETIFGDPCPGVRKVVRIEFTTRGFQGSLRVRESQGTLVAAVEVGFPQDAGSDDAYTINL